jgi:hypothetical protein
MQRSRIPEHISKINFAVNKELAKPTQEMQSIHEHL